MEPQVEYLDGHRAQIIVKVDDETLEKGRRLAAKRLAGDLRIPGFRPGKAPYDVIVQYIGEESLNNEALDDIGNEVYQKALENAEIEPYASGQVTDLDLEDGLTITFVVPMQPTVELGDYRSIRHDYERDEVTDEDVENSLARTRESLALTEDVSRPAEFNDKVLMDIHGYFVDADEAEAEDEEAAPEANTDTSAGDEPEDEDTHDHDHEHSHDEKETFIHEHQMSFMLLEDEARDLVPGFSPEVVGMRVGDEKTFRITIADDEEDEDLAGRTIKFTVNVLKVENTVMPALDDFLASLASDGEYNTLDELRSTLRDQLEELYENRANDAYTSAILEKIVGQASFTYPDETFQDYMDDVMRELEDYMQQQAGLRLEDYARIMNKTIDDLREENRERAERRMKNSLALTALAESEGLTVTEEDIEAEIDKQLSELVGAGYSAELRSIFDSPTYRERLMVQIISDHTLKRMMDIAKGLEPEKGPDNKPQDDDATVPAATAETASASEAEDDQAEATQSESEESDNE